MRVTDYNYDLPPELIATRPPQIRGQSNLLILDRAKQTIELGKYSDLLTELVAGDCLVLNNTRVIKARLIAQTKTGQERELVLLEQHGRRDNWFDHKVLYRGKLHLNEFLQVGPARLQVKSLLGGGIALIKADQDLLQLCQAFGRTPLPPYIKRSADTNDVVRYQTVFAKNSGSVAAPTASLNMTEALLERLRAKGVKIVYLTLHVGLGTFLPIRSDHLEEHQMHKEYFEIPRATVAAIYDAKVSGRRVIALGTTVARSLEYAAADLLAFGRDLADQPEERCQEALSGEADIFIYPGYKFQVLDALITNFHAPKSTVLMLAAAFAGWDFLQAAYQMAIDQKLRFLSYGDSMLIK